MSTTTNVAGVARAAMLVELNVSLYSGRKKDRTTQAEVTAAKGAHSKQAASVYKSLFADCAELEDIVRFQARVRAEHYRLTLPWSDSGGRLLPTTTMMAHQDMMNAATAEFNALVSKFLDRYDTLVAAAAFQLGALFDRAEYPSRDDVAKRFSMSTTISPLPTSGDFRLDIEAEVQNDLAQRYEAQVATLVQRANDDAWQRLYDVLAAMSDRLTIDAQNDGTVKKRVFRDTLVNNAAELCGLLTQLNVAGDPQLEHARARLEDALLGVTAEDLRESDGTRVATKQKVDAILSDFDWFQPEAAEANI